MSPLASYNLRRRRKGREAQTAYKTLVATPQSLGSVAPSASSSQLTLPAGAKFSVQCTVALQVGDVSFLVGGRTYPIQALAATVKKRVSAWGEEDEEISVARGARVFSGTLTINLVDDVGKDRPIATVTLT